MEIKLTAVADLVAPVVVCTMNKTNESMKIFNQKENEPKKETSY